MKQTGIDPHNCLSVAKKSGVGYPQSWKSQKWKNANKDGYFVQLESKTLHKLWFIPIGNATDAEEELPVDSYGLVPHIVQ